MQSFIFYAPVMVSRATRLQCSFRQQAPAISRTPVAALLHLSAHAPIDGFQLHMVTCTRSSAQQIPCACRMYLHNVTPSSQPQHDTRHIACGTHTLHTIERCNTGKVQRPPCSAYCRCTGIAIRRSLQLLWLLVQLALLPVPAPWEMQKRGPNGLCLAPCDDHVWPL